MSTKVRETPTRNKTIAIKLIIKQEDSEEHDRVCFIDDPSCNGRVDKQFVIEEIDSMLNDFGDWVEGYFV